MKYTREHFQILKNRIQSALKAKGVSAKEMQERYRVKGFSDTRFAWDCFWASDTRIGDGIGMSSNCGIEGDYKDSHTNTAIKKALNELGATL